MIRKIQNLAEAIGGTILGGALIILPTCFVLFTIFNMGEIWANDGVLAALGILVFDVMLASFVISGVCNMLDKRQ